MKQKGRQANFELLRIVAMMMIIALHYLVKGQVAYAFSENDTAVNYVACLVEAFCIVAVNCYVLISGYFCLESEWKPGRIVSLLCQVLFYAIGIEVIGICAGAVDLAQFSVYELIQVVFPVSTEHYWFVTAYLFMYLFAPILGTGIKQLDEKQHRGIMIALVVFFSGIKTIVPLPFVTDKFGYDFGWFLCLFVVAAYIRQYGFSWLEQKRHAWSMYIGMSGVIWACAIVTGKMAGRVAAMEYYQNMLFCYNHLFCLMASVGLFYIFKNMEIRKEAVAGGIIVIAPYTFGVYLMHEHALVRYEWMKWLGVERASDSLLFIPNMLFGILAVFTVGVCTDYLRTVLFHYISRLCIGNKNKKNQDAK